MESHPNLMRIRMVLPALGMFNALPYVSIPVHVASLSKKPTPLPEGMLIGVGTILLEVIGHQDQAADIQHRGKAGE